MKKNISVNQILRFFLYICLFLLIPIFLILFRVSIYSFFGLLFIFTAILTAFNCAKLFSSIFYTFSYKIDLKYTPTITFVIPCKNEEKAIYNTISRCFKVNYPKNRVQVVAINDGSTDNTLQEMNRVKASFFRRNFIIINQENRGKRQAMKRGFESASGEILIQLDSDSYPHQDCIRTLIAPFKNPQVAAVSAHSEPANKDVNYLTKMQTSYYFLGFRAFKATESTFNMVFCCSGCCSAYRRQYVLDVLDEWASESFLGKKVPFGDDRSLTRLMIQSGYTTLYAADALAYTIVPENMKIFIKQQIRWKKSSIINCIKTLRFIIQRDKYVAFFYFIPSSILIYLSPFITIYALLLYPVYMKSLPWVYILGIFLIALLRIIHQSYYSKTNKYLLHSLLYSFTNLVLITHLIWWATYDLFIKKNNTWGTR